MRGTADLRGNNAATSGCQWDTSILTFNSALVISVSWDFDYSISKQRYWGCGQCGPATSGSALCLKADIGGGSGPCPMEVTSCSSVFGGGELKEELEGDWSPENKDTGKWDLEYCWVKPRGYEKRVWRKRGSK